MIEENLKRKDRGDAIPSPAKVGGGARNAEADGWSWISARRTRS
jgi:hypothetical protein